MYKTLFCLSAAALCFTAGAFAEDAQTEVVEQALAGCNCGNKTSKPKETSEGDKGNKDVAAIENGEEAVETTLSCGKCK